MKQLILSLLVFSLTPAAFAADKVCLKGCRSELSACKTRIHDWTEEQYIDAQGSEEYLSNKQINAMYNMIDDKEKAMKKACKSEFTECELACKTSN